MNSLLEVKEIKKEYGKKPVVRGLSFDVKKEEVVGLLGPNGAGKTTAFYMTMGLIAPDDGQVFFEGKNITDLPVHKRATLGMGYLAQEPSVFADLSVEDNILCVLETQGLSKQDMQMRLNELLGELHLEKHRKKLAAVLSGGERRRLEITRALITRPKLLLLDEPFANIDPISVQDVKDLIRHLKKRGISVLITDHNAREIFSIVDRSFLIQEGKVLMSGTVDQLLASKEARRVYFGENFRL
jgi:lipopolysaccharide export system ATP-binding protein